MNKISFRSCGSGLKGPEPPEGPGAASTAGAPVRKSDRGRSAGGLLFVWLAVAAVTAVAVWFYAEPAEPGAASSSPENAVGAADERMVEPGAPVPRGGTAEWRWLDEARTAWAAKDWEEAEKKLAVVLAAGAGEETAGEARELAGEIEAYKSEATGWIRLAVSPAEAVCFLNGEEVEDTGRVGVRGIGEHVLTVVAPRYETETVVARLGKPGEEIELPVVRLAPSAELLAEHERQRHEAEAEAERLRQAARDAEREREELQHKLAATERERDRQVANRENSRRSGNDRATPAPTGGQSSKRWKLVYGGSEGVSMRNEPAGRQILATVYRHDDLLIRGLGEDLVVRDGVRWAKVELDGWMARRMLGDRKPNLVQRSDGTSIVTWDGGGNKNDNFVALKAGPGVSTDRFAKVFTHSVVATSDSRVHGNHEWVRARLTGWIATTSPRGTRLLAPSSE